VATSSRSQRYQHGRDTPLAYLITFRTYATWLPGDERGTVDNRHNIPGTPLLPANPKRKDAYAAGSRSHVAELTPTRRDAVLLAITETCQHREWEIHAVSVRSNHVHIVMSGMQEPEQIMTTLKAYATRRLRELGLAAPDARIWSRHGSTKYLWDLDGIRDACAYVLDAQDVAR